MTLPPTKMRRFGVDFPFMVAPMVGVSHVAFRELIRSYTPLPVAPLLFTEMLSTRRIPSQRLEEAEHLRSYPGECRTIPQLLGNEERFIAPSVEKLSRLSPWGFDINMGCPAKKTLAHNWGVLLMGDRQYAADVVRMTKRYSSVPVSVKLRAGIGERIDVDYLLDFTSAVEAAGADWMTLHCRTRLQRHTGDANWEIFSKVAEKRSIPVVANGDIQTADDALNIVNAYGADGAMFARAATARPWVLWQVAYRLGLAAALPPMTAEEEGREYFRSLYRLCGYLEQFFLESERPLDKLKLYVGINHRWLLFGHAFWLKLKRTKTLAEAKAFIVEYAEQHPQPLAGRVFL